MHAFILGLRDHWRGDALAAQAEEFGFATEIVWGINGRTDFTSEMLGDIYDDALARDVMGRPLSTGEIAVALGHRIMYERFLKTDDDWALFLEDDGSLTQGVLDVVPDLSLLDDLPTIVTLRVHDVGHNLRWPARRKGMVARLIEPPFGSSCYFMNRQGAETALAAYKRYRVDSIPDFPVRWKFQVRFWMSLVDLSPHTYEGSVLAQDRDAAVQDAQVLHSSVILGRLRLARRLASVGMPTSDLLKMTVTQPVLVRVMAAFSKLGMSKARISG